MKLPSYVVDALRKGLALHRAGKSGDGLVPATVAMATRGVSSGEWPDEKILRASAWFARHIGDRQRMKSPRTWDEEPDYSPAYVAWLLWGSDSDDRGRNWIDSQAQKIRESIAGMGASIKAMRRKSEAPGDRASSTPAPPEDRIKGGKNTGRAGGRSRATIVLGRAINAALRRKIKDHNAEVADAPSKRATLPMLQKVYLRGAGAFSTSHRPGTTRSQWALARVNAFLYLLKIGKPKDPKYITDNDLLPSSHPRASKKKESIKGGAMKSKAYGRTREAVEDPTTAQRRDLPAAAFMPTAFMQDGEFLRSKSKLPHHINTASDPDDNETVDVPRLRNALARFNQTDFSEFPGGTRERSRAHLERHADAILYKAKEGKCTQCSDEEVELLRAELNRLRG